MMSFLESVDTPLSSGNEPGPIAGDGRSRAYLEKKQRMTLSNRISLSGRSRRSVTSSTASLLNFSSDAGSVNVSDAGSMVENKRRSSKAMQALPQYYRGNHGEVGCVG